MEYYPTNYFCFLSILFLVLLVVFFIIDSKQNKNSISKNKTTDIDTTQKIIKENQTELTKFTNFRNLREYNENEYAFRLNNRLLNKTEYRIYRLLVEYLKDRGVIVFCQVRMADVISCVSSHKSYFRDFPKVRSKHLDFLVVDKNDTRPIFAVEIDGWHHRYFSQVKKNDKFKNEVFLMVGLPLIRYVQGQNSETILLKEINKVINEYNGS